jgi:hypothetical protein
MTRSRHPSSDLWPFIDCVDQVLFLGMGWATPVSVLTDVLKRNTRLAAISIYWNLSAFCAPGMCQTPDMGGGGLWNRARRSIN